MSAREAWDETPAWEVEELFRERHLIQQERERKERAR